MEVTNSDSSFFVSNASVNKMTCEADPRNPGFSDESASGEDDDMDPLVVWGKDHPRDHHTEPSYKGQDV